MIRSHTPNSKAASSNCMVSLHLDAKSHAKKFESQLCTSNTNNGKIPAELEKFKSSNKSSHEISHRRIGPIHRMVHFVTMRKKKRKNGISNFSKLRVRRGGQPDDFHPHIDKPTGTNSKTEKSLSNEGYQGLLRRIATVNLEKLRQEEDFISKVHDLRMLKEMAIEGSDEFIELLKQIDILQSENAKSQRELQNTLVTLVATINKASSLDLGSHDKICAPMNNILPCESFFPYDEGDPKYITYRYLKQRYDKAEEPHGKNRLSLRITPSESEFFNDLDSPTSMNQITDDSGCEFSLTTNKISNAASFVTDQANIDEKTLSSSGEFEELQEIIIQLIEERNNLKHDFDGFCKSVSDLLSNTEDLNKTIEDQADVGQKLVTMGASKDALILEQQNLCNDINLEWKEQIAMLERIIDSQTHEMKLVFKELDGMKSDSEESEKRNEVLSKEMNELSRRYHENLESIKALQDMIQEEESRSVSLLQAKDFEFGNILNARDDELANMKNEVSVISIENVLLSNKIYETSTDLLYSKKMVSDLKGKVNELILFVDQLKSQNGVLRAEIVKLSDTKTSDQQGFFETTLKLFNELRKARDAVLHLQKENASLSNNRITGYDTIDDEVVIDTGEYLPTSSHSCDKQEEIVMLHGMVRKIEAEKEELRRKYITLFELIAVIDAQNTFQIGQTKKTLQHYEMELKDTGILAKT